MAWFQKPRADHAQVAFAIVESTKRNRAECTANMHRIAHDFKMTPDSGWEERVPVACLVGGWSVMLHLHNNKARDLMPYLRTEADRMLDGIGDEFIEVTMRMYESFAEEWTHWSPSEFEKHTMLTMVSYVFGPTNMPRFAPTMATFAGNMFWPVLGEVHDYLGARRIG